MNIALWIAKKNELCHLIKQVSDHYGGDDADWLRLYADTIIEENKWKLDKPIACFEDLISEFQVINDNDTKIYNVVDRCGKCGYRPVFCLC